MSTSNAHQQSIADVGSETRPPMLERGEALVSVYNHFAQLMNDLERNDIIFPNVIVNTKFLNCLQPEWLKYVTQKLVNASKAKKLEKSHDPLALVAHTGSSSRTTTPYYVTHPPSVVDYADEYHGDVVQKNFDDSLTSAMILLARAITQRFSNPTNNRLRTSSNTKNQAIIQGDRVNIQRKNSRNDGRNIRCLYVQEEIIEGNNVPNDVGNIHRILRTTSSGTAANVQCYNCSEKGHYARNFPKPRVWDSKYLMEQMLLAKQDEAGVILTNEQNDFLFADASRMEEIKELTGSENRPHMLNKENYVPWSSRLLRYAKSRPNGKLIHNSIINSPYVRRVIPEPGDPNREKKAKLFNEWERFTSTNGESIESYYHRSLKLMNDLKRNKRFPEKIASNLKFLNNLQPEWSRHVTIVHQTKDLHTADYTQLYDFQKYNQKENVRNLNGYNDVQNVRNQVIQNAVQNMRIQNVGNQNGLIGVPENANQNPNRNGNLVAARAEDLDEIEEVNANCILMANLQQASTSGTQTDKAPVYDSDGSVEVHNYENCYDNEIFNMFTQEEQYTELLEPIPEPHQVPQNDNNVIYEVSSMEQSGGTIEQHPANVEETRVLYDSLYNNLAIEVEKVKTVNRKLKETNAELTTELARFKNQEKCLEISQEKYDKLERCYQKSVYQEQCLSKKINALHLSS
nr:Gag-Pol polyprotein [Tanacetum cinerariifolium]